MVAPRKVAAPATKIAALTPTLIELAAIFTVSKGTVDKWVASGKLAPTGSTLADHVKAFGEHKGTTGNGDGALTKEKIRTEKARADKLEVQVERLRWEVVPVDDVEVAITAALIELRSNLLSLPNDIGQEIAPITDVAECVEIIRTRVYAAMTSIAESSVDNIVTEALKSADAQNADREEDDLA